MSRIAGWMPPLFVLLQSCQIFSYENRLEYPELAIQPNPEVQDFSTTLTTDFVRMGNQPFVSYGLCWNTTGAPGLDDSTSFNAGRPPLLYFTSVLTGLRPLTKYYLRAFAQAGSRTTFSPELTFKTLARQSPQVTTGEVVAEGAETLTLRGRLGESGTGPVLQHGFCWSTSPGPTTANPRTQQGGGAPGDFVGTITGLRSGVRYYIRAYATNERGTGYGEELSVTKSCLSPPAMGGSSIGTVTATTALATGNIASKGCSDIAEYGHCWSLQPNPTIADFRTAYLAGTTGAFTSALASLAPGTLYYVRAYATNAQGTVYGNQLTLTTKQP